MNRKVLALVLVSMLSGAVNAESNVGSIHLTSGGPIAFGPDGVLFVSDPMAATIYAVQTPSQQANSGKPAVDDLRGKTRRDVGHRVG